MNLQNEKCVMVIDENLPMPARGFLLAIAAFLII